MELHEDARIRVKILALAVAKTLRIAGLDIQALKAVAQLGKRASYDPGAFNLLCNIAKAPIPGTKTLAGLAGTEAITKAIHSARRWRQFQKA